MTKTQLNYHPCPLSPSCGYPLQFLVLMISIFPLMFHGVLLNSRWFLRSSFLRSALSCSSAGLALSVFLGLMRCFRYFGFAISLRLWFLFCLCSSEAYQLLLLNSLGSWSLHQLILVTSKSNPFWSDHRFVRWTDSLFECLISDLQMLPDFVPMDCL